MGIEKVYNARQVEAEWLERWGEKDLFKSVPDHRTPYTIVIPPPNVTGILHMGHMLNNTIQDILIRRARLRDFNVCWVPGGVSSLAADLLIYLRSNIPNLVDQIHKRGRDYENSISIEYLSRLNERYEAWIQSYDKSNLLIIDVDDIDFVENKEDFKSIVAQIDAKIKKL